MKSQYIPNLEAKRPPRRSWRRVRIAAAWLALSSAGAGIIGCSADSDVAAKDPAVATATTSTNKPGIEAEKHRPNFADRTKENTQKIIEAKEAGKATPPLTVRFGVALIKDMDQEIGSKEPGPMAETALLQPLSFRIYLHPIVESERQNDGSVQTAYVCVGNSAQVQDEGKVVAVSVNGDQTHEVVAQTGEKTRTVTDYSYSDGFADGEERFGYFVYHSTSETDINVARQQAIDQAQYLLNAGP